MTDRTIRAGSLSECNDPFANAFCWLPPEDEAPFRLFCLPYAGGGLSVFRGWGEALAGKFQVWGAQLPARDRRILEAPEPRVEAVVQDLVEGLAGNLDRPFGLFGHSMGGMLGFEVARELQRRKWPLPEVLIASAARPPHSFGGGWLHTKPLDEFVRGLKRMGGLPDGLISRPHVIEKLVPRIRADFELCETYEPSTGPTLECPVVCLTGAEDHSSSESTMVGWRKWTTGPVSTHVFPGGHFFIHSQLEPMTKVVAESFGFTGLVSSVRASWRAGVHG